MRWMFAIKSAVTISWKAEPSRMKQQDAGTHVSNAVCRFNYECLCMCAEVKYFRGTLRPTESLQEAKIC